MNRSLSVMLALAAALSMAGCNNATCGAGTKQVQNKGGTLSCVPVDALPNTIPCDVDAGAQIVGGQCVSFVTCGPNTMYDPTTGVCTGTGTGGGLPDCPTPKPGTSCVHGLLHNFVDNGAYTGPDVQVALYDPLAFLAGKPALSTGTSSGGGYVFQDFTPPGLQLIAIAVGNLNDESMIAVSASGAQNVVPGAIYRVDVYVIPRSVTDGWMNMTGVDYLGMGAYVAKFYGDKAPAPTNLAATETMKMPGVMLTQDGTVPTNVQYFSSDLATIDKTLTVTGMEGAAIVPSPANGATPSFSGMGGTVNGMTPTWESQLGGSTNKVIFVSRFHPTM